MLHQHERDIVYKRDTSVGKDVYSKQRRVRETAKRKADAKNTKILIRDLRARSGDDRFAYLLRTQDLLEPLADVCKFPKFWRIRSQLSRR